VRNSPPQASRRVSVDKFIGHPLHANCAATSTLTTSHREITNADDSDLLRARNVVEFSVSEHPSPHKIINFGHTGLIASDLGHIAHLFRRFHGGGSSRFSQTIDAGKYSENSPDSDRRHRASYCDADVLRTSIATMWPSRGPNCRRKWVALTVQIVRMHRCA
jgi:hypothetical protein